MVDVLAHIIGWVLAVIVVVGLVLFAVIAPLDRGARGILALVLILVWMIVAVVAVLYIGGSDVTTEGFLYVFGGAAIWSLYCTAVGFFRGRHRDS